MITTMDALPDHCFECPCHEGESGYCQADKERRYSLEYRPYWCPLKEIHVKEQKNGLIQHGGFIEIDDSMKLEPISLDVFIDDLVRSAMNEKLKGDKDD